MHALLVAFVLDLVVATPAASGPSCVTSGDTIVCGYHCTTSFGRAACAQTPEGLCVATTSRVVCWDPPPDIRQLMHTRDDLEAPQCISGLGRGACGYHCVTEDQKVACADTPMGACGWRFGKVRCWDPPPEVRWQMEAQNDLQIAQCERTLTDVVCGYHCVDTADQVRCASSPWGMCERHFDELACWDPAPMLQQPPCASDRR